MKKAESYLTVSDGFELYTVLYAPERPKAHIHILHGMAEHIGRYEEFALFLMNEGYAVSGHDQRGHGKTAEQNGKLGYFADFAGFERVVQDAHEVIGMVQKETGDLPLILFGHSMGSFIARRYIQLHSEAVTKVILSGSGGDPKLPGKAGLALAQTASHFKGKTEPSPVLTKLTFGRFSRAFPDEESEYAWLTSDEEIIREYVDDPLSGFIPTNQFFVDLFTGIFRVHEEKEVQKIRKELPVLFISGAEDPVGEKGDGVFMAARQFSDAGIEDVTVFLAEEGRHELLNELKKAQHFSTILGWLNRDG